MGDLVSQHLDQQRRAQQPDLLQQLINQERAREAARMGMMPPDPSIADAFAGRGQRQPPAQAGGITRAQLQAEAQRRQDALRAATEGGAAPSRPPQDGASANLQAVRYEAVMRALRKAQEAGLTDEARRLALLAAQLRPTQAEASTVAPAPLTPAQQRALEDALGRVQAEADQGGTGGVSPAQQDILNQVFAGEPAPAVSPEVQRARDEALRRVQAEAGPRGLTTGQGAPAGETTRQRLERLADPNFGQGSTRTPEQETQRAPLSPEDAARYDELLARLERLRAPPPIPGSEVVPHVDANAFGGPPSNADAMASLLTREGQAARREAEGYIPRTNEWLGGVMPTPRQAWRNLNENLWGDGDPTTMNRGEAFGAALNKAGESMTFGLLGDEAAGWFDENILNRGPAAERTQFYRDQEDQLWDQRPGLALTAEIGGALLGPGKGIGAFINRGVGTGARVGRGLLAGAGTGAVYGAAEAERDLAPMEQGSVGGVMDRAVGGLLGAGIGGIAGAAVTGVGQGFNRAAQALRGTAGGDEAAASVAGLKDASQGLYRAADEAGVVLPQSRLGQLAQDATAAVRAEGYNHRLHPRLRAVLSELKDVAQGDQSLSRLEIARRVAGNAARSLEPDERRLASIVIDKIDDMIEELGDSSAPLRAARDLWARGSRLGRIEEILENASNVGPKGSYEDALANGFRSFLRNPRNLRGFSDAEKRLMQQLARGSAGVRALRSLSELLNPFGAPGVGAMAGALYTGNPVAAILSPLAGLASRAGSNAIVRGQASALQRMAGQTGAQRAVVEGLLRQPNALVGAANGATPQGLLSYTTQPEPLRLTVDGSPPRY